MRTVLDDASRKVLAAGEFDNATEENSLEVMKEEIISGNDTTFADDMK